MSALSWLIPVLILAVIFLMVGLRDLVNFFGAGPGRRRGYGLWILGVLWVSGVVGIWHFWRPALLGSMADPFWAKVLGFSLGLFVLVCSFSSLRRRGPGRMWALAGATFAEAMSQRAWLAVPLWLIGVLVVGMFISPFRLVQDRMMLITELLVRGQLLVVGVLILALACRSIPRELETKTITVTASKPINMLELVAGKLLGFLVLAVVLVGAMGVLSYGILWYNGRQVRRAARQELAVQQRDYDSGQREIPPDADLKDIADKGVLYARDPIYPLEPVGFNGKFYPGFDLEPCLKGGTFSKIEWRFENIPVTDRVPWLVLGLGVERVPEEIPHKEDFDPGAPLKIKVEAQSVRFPRRGRVKKEIEIRIPRRVERLGLAGPVGFSFRYQLFLDPERWGYLYNVGPVLIKVNFPVHGHYLYFREGSAELQNLSPDVTEVGAEQRRMLARGGGRGRVVAKHFRNAYEISGTAKGEPEVAYWHFKDVPLENLPAGEEVGFEIQTYSEKSDTVKFHAVGLVRAMVIKPDGRMEPWPKPGQSEEAAEQKDQDWPGWHKVVMQERRPTVVHLPKSLFGEGGDVYVFLSCALPDGWISVGEKSGYLARGRRWFVGNVLRCEAIVFMQVTAIGAVGVMASSFLSWPVACFLSMVIYLIGAARSSLQGMVQFWGTASERATSYVIDMLGAILPDFSAYKATAFIADGELIASEKLAGLFSHTMLIALGLVVVAYLLMRTRELAK